MRLIKSQQSSRILTRGMPVPHAGLPNSGRRLSGKMIGKKTRNRKLPKQGVPICQSALAKSAVRPPRIAENKRKQELREKKHSKAMRWRMLPHHVTL
jgi:hypothetical protein